MASWDQLIPLVTLGVGAFLGIVSQIYIQARGEKHSKKRLRSSLYREIIHVYGIWRSLVDTIESGYRGAEHTRAFVTSHFFNLYEFTITTPSQLELFYQLKDSAAIELAYRILHSPFKEPERCLEQTDDELYSHFREAVHYFELGIKERAIGLDSKLMQDACPDEDARSMIERLFSPEPPMTLQPIGQDAKPK